MTVKSMTAEIKSVGEGKEAEFEAYASVFGNIDSYGDVVRKGAFADSLKAWEGKGAPIPLLWGHNMMDPEYNIGMVKSAVEDEHGLRVVCSIDTECAKGAHVYRLLKQGRVREMSFAFSTTDVEEGEQEGQQVRFLNSVDLHEVSVVPLGANPETEILAVKAPTLISDDLMERLINVLEAVVEASDPPDDDPDDEDPADDTAGSSAAGVDSSGSGTSSTDEDDEEDDQAAKADLDRLETMFRAVGRD